MEWKKYSFNKFNHKKGKKNGNSTIENNDLEF